MGETLTDNDIHQQGLKYQGTGGCSQVSSPLGFQPAFLDTATRTIYLSRFADGRLAHLHILDGLPEELVVERAEDGRVLTIKPSLVSGFAKDGRFYTRDECASLLASMERNEAPRCTPAPA
ncbi:MAG: hypothetical protein AB1810_06700 [Pseudomonadota bacterium]